MLDIYTRGIPRLKFGRAACCPRLALVVGVYLEASLANNSVPLLKEITAACLQAVVDSSHYTARRNIHR